MEATGLAIRASSFPQYAAIDVDSGRCRMSRVTMLKHKLTKMGNIAKLRLYSGSWSYCILCTVWSDSGGWLEEGQICVDPVVVTNNDGNIVSDWMECKYEVLEVQPAAMLATVTVRCSSPDSWHTAHLLGLPLSADAVVNLSSGLAPREQLLVIGTSSRLPGIVSTSTTLIRPAAWPAQAVESSAPEIHSNISVVRGILQRVIEPSIAHCSGHLARCSVPYLHTRGLLLVGPPGVGKTYAVKAAKALCEGACKVHIFEVNIPNLLCEPDPTIELDRVFQSVDRLRMHPCSSAGTVERAVATSASRLASPATPASPVPTSPGGGGRQSQSTAVPSTPLGAARTAGGFLSAARTPGGFLSGGRAATGAGGVGAGAGAGTGTASKVKNNTFVYRSPAAMAKATSNVTPVKSSAVKGVVSNSDAKENERINVVTYSPEVAFIVVDEIDALGQPGQHNEKQIAIKQYLCRWMDHQHRAAQRSNNSATFSGTAMRVPCCLVGTSNRSSDIDPSLRRGGRLEHEVAVSNTPQDRRALLANLLATHIAPIVAAPAEGVVDASSVTNALADRLALQTGGYVAADLAALVAALRTDVEGQLQSISGTEGLQSNDSYLSVLMEAFHRVSKAVGPSCLRGASVTLPSLTYDDIVGYESVKRSLQRVVSFARPELQQLTARFGLGMSPGGVLLYGPPGNSKTRLASAAAAHHGLPMITLSAADIYSPYVGDAEAEVRRAFQLARQAAPCVLFIDELDSIVTNRDTNSAGGGGGSTSASVEGRVLATLLTEMDGMQNTAKSSSDEKGAGARNSSGGVIVLGATNRLDFIDAALIRKGRFHHVLHVPPPDASERLQLLWYFGRKCNLEDDAVAVLAGQLRPGMSGAEVENLCREAAVRRLQEYF